MGESGVSGVSRSSNLEEGELEEVVVKRVERKKRKEMMRLNIEGSERIELEQWTTAWKTFISNTIVEEDKKELGICPICSIALMVGGHKNAVDGYRTGCPNFDEYILCFSNWIGVMYMNYEYAIVDDILSGYFEEREAKEVWMRRYMRLNWRKTEPRWSKLWNLTRVRDILKTMLKYWKKEKITKEERLQMACCFGGELKEKYKNVDIDGYRFTKEEEKEQVIRARNMMGIRVETGVEMEGDDG